MATAPAVTPANPFSTRFVRPDGMTYRFAAGQDAGAVADATIAQLTRRGTAAIIGPHGTGKSTLLHTLAPQLGAVFPRVEWIRLSATSNAVQQLWQWRREQVTAATAVACLVIDGFEQLPWAVRLYLAWRSRRVAAWRRSDRPIASQPCLLVTAHRPQWGIRTVYRTGWNDAVVKTLTAEKLRDLPEPERQTMLRVAEQLADRLAQGEPIDRNVRDYWFSLYDEYERLRVPDSFAATRRRNTR
jgi:ABC-type dipeptide/oligopeptide/nickel transport system ATPase subunit